MSIKQKPYREQLIATIKDIGQEIIDRAEYMVDEGCDMITNFGITVDIPQPMDGPPVLSWNTSVCVKNFIDRKFGRAYHAEGTSKITGVVLEDVQHEGQ